MNAVIPGRDLTILHCAALSYREETSLLEVLELPKFDPSVNINKPLGYARSTVMHTCARLGWADAARRLLQHGADPLQSNKDGLSPFLVAIIKKHADIVRIFLKHGCDPYHECPDIFPSVQVR